MEFIIFVQIKQTRYKVLVSDLQRCWQVDLLLLNRTSLAEQVKMRQIFSHFKKKQVTMTIHWEDFLQNIIINIKIYILLKYYIIIKWFNYLQLDHLELK